MTKPSYEELERELAAHEKVIIERLRKDPTTRIFGLSVDDIQRLIHIENAGGWNAWTRRIEQERDDYKASLARVRGLLQRQWVPIESAPKTGEHILVAVFDGGVGFGTCGGKKQAWAGVVHYWEPDEPGWYMSTANGDIRVEPTHWQPIVPQSSSLVSQGAESADIGKLDDAEQTKEKSMAYSINHANMTEPFDKLSDHLQDCCGGCPYCVELCQQVVDEANAKTS